MSKPLQATQIVPLRASLTERLTRDHRKKHARTRSHQFRELLPPYVVSAPEMQMAPFVLCSPHSGSIYPPSFVALSRLEPAVAQKIGRLLRRRAVPPVAAAGVPLIAARFPAPSST